MLINYIFFDLDDTLYPSSAGLWDAIGDRINLYMVERLKLPPGEVTALRDHYLQAHGTTLNGLVREHGIEPDDYLAYVHDLPLEAHIHPSPALTDMLERLPQYKIVLTNADLAHAQRVLARLGLQSHFDAIVDIRALNWVNKPEPKAYRRAMELAGAKEPGECMLIEDSIRNLRAARALGMLGVYVGAQDPGDDADFVLRDISELTRVVPGLLNGDILKH